MCKVSNDPISAQCELVLREPYRSPDDAIIGHAIAIGHDEL